jgi:hypothetical protein
VLCFDFVDGDCVVVGGERLRLHSKIDFDMPTLFVAVAENVDN